MVRSDLFFITVLGYCTVPYFNCIVGDLSHLVAKFTEHALDVQRSTYRGS